MSSKIYSVIKANKTPARLAKKKQATKKKKANNVYTNNPYITIDLKTTQHNCLSEKKVPEAGSLGEKNILWCLLTGLVESRFRSSPSVFIKTSTSGSDRSPKTCSLPRAVRTWALILWSAWKAMFMRAQTPFRRREGSSRRVRPHSISTAPHSRIGWTETGTYYLGLSSEFSYLILGNPLEKSLLVKRFSQKSYHWDNFPERTKKIGCKIGIENFVILEVLLIVCEDNKNSFLLFYKQVSVV